MTKTIRVSEEVHEKIASHKREDETFSETLERLIEGPSLRSIAGILSDEEAEEFRAAIEESYEADEREKDKLIEEFK